MNNTKYADVLMDALNPEELSGRFLSELQLNYSQECKAGEIMEISRVLDGNSCYIDGCSGDGKRRFEASLQFAPYSRNVLDEARESE
jgi:acyl-ACP thioesterase